MERGLEHLLCARKTVSPIVPNVIRQSKFFLFHPHALTNYKILLAYHLYLVFCTEPPTIKNARHNAPADQKTFNLDESLQYQCMPGYVTKGFARTKCFFYNGTAKWFGPDITCEGFFKYSFTIIHYVQNDSNMYFLSSSQKLW